MFKMMLYSWISFWITYFVGGCLLFDDKDTIVLPNYYVSMKDLLNTLGLNALLTFLCIPVVNMIPTLISVSDTWSGYITRVVLSLLIGDMIFYWTHRLFHHPLFYKYHKKHHLFIKPHSLAGMYAHPLESIISNHLSMVIPLKLIECHSIPWLMLESAIVSLNILKSHSGQENKLRGSPHHNAHHEKMNCNYGFSYITDILFGTYVST